MERIAPGAAHGDTAIPDEILTEAATWLMELHEGPLGPGQRIRFAQWRQRSPAHERAWEKAAVLLEKFNTLPPPGAVALKKISAPERRKAIKMLAAALAIGPAAWIAYRAAPWSDPAGHYRTAVGERRELVLDDGSRVNLNTDTRIEVAFSASERRIRLQRGEVMITTAKDRLQQPRPFLVTVEEGRIRALGTRFTVQQLDRSSRVAVFEGAVEISPAGMPSAATVMPAGMQTTFTRTQVAPPSSCDDAAAAWTSGMLMADRMPMERFIAELGRYRSGTLQIDSRVAALPVSGVFPVNDTGLTLALLEQTMPVRMQYFTRYWVKVVPR
ncbi:FecR domain-containing protein [Herbaspirillum robiniae]|nr:FecR family protein [Herbaspirillum robiniae]